MRAILRWTAAVALLAAAPALGQQTPAPNDARMGPATVSGRVLDVNTGQPIAGAVVYLPTIRRGAITNDEGGFVLEHVPEGDFRWRIQRLGYATWESDSPIADGDWFTVRLLPRPEVLAGITVTADAFETRRRRVSVAVQAAERPDILRAAARNGAEVLESVGGVDVVRCGGMSLSGSGTTNPGRQPLSMGRAMGGLSGQPASVNPVTGRQVVEEENPTNVTTGQAVHAPASDEDCVMVNGQMIHPQVYLDEELSNVSQLATVSPAEIYLVEVYARGEYVYVYTQGFVEYLARHHRRPRAFTNF